MYRYIKAEEYGGEELEYNYADTMGRISGEVDANGTLYTADEVIRKSAYASRRDIIKVIAPNCKKLEDEAFINCYKLQSIDLPNCEKIGDSVFEDCINLQDVNCPKVVNIDENAFYACAKLQHIDLPYCYELQGWAFAWCENLKSINAENLAFVGQYAFYKTPLSGKFGELEQDDWEEEL